MTELGGDNPLLAPAIDCIADQLFREMLEAISRRMQAVFDGMTSGLLLIGDDLRIMDANPAFCALIERKVESIVGHPVSAVLPASEMNSLRQEAASEEEMVIVVQVNGKLRSKITVPVSIPEEDIKRLAQHDERVQQWVEGKDLKNVIYVPRKLVNLVAV